MAGNPLRKVMPGDPLDISADTFNTLIDTAAWKKLQERRQARPQSAHSVANPAVILVRNGSGADRAQGEALGLSGAIFGPDENLEGFKGQVAVVGEALDHEQHRGRVAILLEPAADGRLARAAVAGVVAAKVDVTDEDHKFAAPVQGEEGMLSSVADGGCQIIYKPDGTGELWCYVQLTDSAPPSAAVVSIIGDDEQLDTGDPVEPNDQCLWSGYLVSLVSPHDADPETNEPSNDYCGSPGTAGAVWIFDAGYPQVERLPHRSRHLAVYAGRVSVTTGEGEEAEEDERPLYAICAPPQATRCNAELAEDYTSGDEAVKVKSVVGLDGVSPVEDENEELTVAVFFENWPSTDEGAKCKIERNATDNRWELYQLDC